MQASASSWWAPLVSGGPAVDEKKEEAAAQTATGISGSRTVGIKRRKLGGFGGKTWKGTLSRSSAWELLSDASAPEAPSEEAAGSASQRGWLVPLANPAGTTKAPQGEVQEATAGQCAAGEGG